MFLGHILIIYFKKVFMEKITKKIIFHFILHIYLESDFHEKSKLWA